MLGTESMTRGPGRGLVSCIRGEKERERETKREREREREREQHCVTCCLPEP